MHHDSSTAGHRRLNSAAVVVKIDFEDNANITFLVADGTKNVSIADLGYTYKVLFDAGTLAFWNHEKEIKLFHILQYHVHCPSEHTFDGEYYDCEVHFVH